MTAAPGCTCGHDLGWHDVPSQRCSRMGCDCECFAVPGSLDDILGVWHAQGPFPLRNTDDVKLLVDEIIRLRGDLERTRAQVLIAATRAAGDVTEHHLAIETCLRDMVIATGPLAARDASSDVLFKLLDVRARACELLDIDPAGHDWPTES